MRTMPPFSMMFARPERTFGREKVVTQLLNAKKPVALVAFSKFGKSTVVKNLESEIDKDPKKCRLSIDFTFNPHFGSFKDDVGPVVDAVAEFGKRYNAEIWQPNGLFEAVEKTGEFARANGMGLMVVADEAIHALKGEDRGEKITRLLELQKKSRGISFVYTFHPWSYLKTINAEKEFAKQVEMAPLGALDENDCGKMLSVLKDYGVKVDGGFVATMMKLTGGLPYLITIVVEQIFRAGLGGSLKRAGSLERAIKKASGGIMEAAVRYTRFNLDNMDILSKLAILNVLAGQKVGRESLAGATIQLAKAAGKMEPGMDEKTANYSIAILYGASFLKDNAIGIAEINGLMLGEVCKFTYLRRH